MNNIRNINTLAADLLDELHEHERMSKQLQNANPSPVKAVLNYGAVRAGILLLQERFLNAMDSEQLDYKKINRGD